MKMEVISIGSLSVLELFGTVVVSLGCCNKLSYTWQFKPAYINSFLILEAKNSTSRVLTKLGLFGGAEGGSVSCLSPGF